MTKHVSVEAFPPAEYIREAMEARDWTQNDLAEVMGRNRHTVLRLLNGKTAITPETAHALAQAFGTSAEVWMNLQTSYELALAAKDDREIERRARLYSRFPIREMQKRTWITESKDTANIEESLCRLLEIKNIEQTPQIAVAARKGTEYGEDSRAHVAWYFKVRSLSRKLDAATYREERLDELFRNLRQLTAYPDDLRRVPRVLADAGVKLVLVKHLSKTRLDGVATWVDGMPVIGLSMRYDRIDNFWFNLLHELVHIKYRDQSPIDFGVISADNDLLAAIEQRANEEAAEALISNKHLRSFIARHKDLFSHEKVIRFAHARGVHPGIVVGQLQHAKALPPTHLNKLKAKCREHILGQTITDGWGHQPVDN